MKDTLHIVLQNQLLTTGSIYNNTSSINQPLMGLLVAKKYMKLFGEAKESSYITVLNKKIMWIYNILEIVYPIVIVVFVTFWSIRIIWWWIKAIIYIFTGKNLNK